MMSGTRSRRLLLAALVSALVLPPLSLPTATEVAAVGPECSDLNLPNRLDPAPSGRITVLYNANQVTDPTELEAQARAVAIVRELQTRADDALDRYQQLGFAVPSSATIKILCAPVLGITDRNAVVPVPGQVQIKSSCVREQFADAEYNGAGFEARGVEQRLSELVDDDRPRGVPPRPARDLGPARGLPEVLGALGVHAPRVDSDAGPRHLCGCR